MTQRIDYEPMRTDRIVGELRSGAGMIKWLCIIVGGLSGAGALGTAMDSLLAAGFGLVGGAMLGALFGGISAATLEWMAEMLLGQRERLCDADAE